MKARWLKRDNNGVDEKFYPITHVDAIVMGEGDEPMGEHFKDTNNPHNVTAEQVGALPNNDELIANKLESLIANGGMSTLQSAIQITNTELKNTSSTFTGTGKGKLFIASGSTVTGVVTIDGKEIGTGHGSSHFEVEFLKSFSVKSNSTANLYCTAVFY